MSNLTTETRPERLKMVDQVLNITNDKKSKNKSLATRQTITKATPTNAKAIARKFTGAMARKYDVFISFRGKDIREGFLSHLFDALQRKQINTFLDENLRKGEEIPPTLLETIEDSYVSIVVFSQNYADSPWCLDELVKILECKETLGQVVLPIFYHVYPTDVQNLTGNFGEAFAFAEHREELKGYLDKVDKWLHALTEISNLSGWDSRNIKSECKLVEKIANDVSEKLRHASSSDSYNDNLVGIDSRVKKVESLLCIESTNDKRAIGIWGMGGIGKTTIAGEVFSRIMAKFDGHYFVDNVREEMRKQRPIVLRDKIIHQLLGDKNLYINTPKLHAFIRRRLKNKKVVIVFDDVDDPNHLKLLAGECALYHNGSRIIVTSRDRHVHKNVCPEDYIYEVEKLNYDEDLCLFSLYAFKQNHPKKGYVNISKKVIAYAQGIPLALRILGSTLYDKEIEEWESELEKLKDIPDMNIQAVLKISYDGLERHEKSIFLDIACLLKEELKDRVERILEGCDFFPRRAISHLIDKSLVTDSNGRMGMHDLLQQMGKDIIYEESKQLGERSRLWKYKDICHVLTTNAVTENVEGILLDVSGNGYLELSSIAFTKMCNLRFLKLFDASYSRQGQVLLPSGLEFLPEELRYLYWERYPLKSLPLNFCPKNLVELHMPRSNLIQLWNRDKALGNLKYLDLSYSFELTRVPDLSSVSNLEVLYLDECRSLIEILSSIGKLKCLKEVTLNDCKKLHSIPQSICNLKSLTDLDISYCLNVNGLPENIGDLELLKLPCLEELHASNCTSLESASTSFLFQEHEDEEEEKYLDFRNCINLDKGVYEKVMEDVLETHLLKHKVVKLFIAGDEVPQTMRYKNQSGSSLSFILDRPHLIGLSFCAVFDPKNCPGDDMADIICKAQFIDKSGDNSKNFDFYLMILKVGLSYSEHVFLWNELFNMEDSFVEASFQFCIHKVSFKPTYHEDFDYEAIIKCGVHPVFRDDCLCRDKKRSRNQEDEEDEPSPQRLKQEQNPSHTQDKS
ncbi:disease resistance protein RPV1-like [Hevea brasiliensis]|uniref:disease resistance protein RPV1-like n=1 Tax=Hevea brasiliensis TaxID=3981 RepID=UPI0025D4D666|nr:disease resistance protein RPV1-like [Hevea brasiliensis]